MTRYIILSFSSVWLAYPTHRLSNFCQIQRHFQIHTTLAQSLNFISENTDRGRLGGHEEGYVLETIL